MNQDSIDQSLETALSLHQSGRLAEAETLYRDVLSIDPDHPDALHLLGVLSGQTARLDSAEEFVRRAIASEPDNPGYHGTLGNILKQLGKLNEAIAAYQQAVHFDPEFLQAHINLANALRDAKRYTESIASHRQAICLKPDSAELHINLATSLRDNGQLDEAIASNQTAIRLNPNLPEAHANLAIALRDAGQLDEAIASYRQALKLKPDFPRAHSGLLFTLNDHPTMDPETLLAAHRAWADRYAPHLPAGAISYANDPSPNRRLRIGYVSGDFRRHSVGYFLTPLLEHRHKQTQEIFCYANIQSADDFTQRMQRSADVWRNITALTDDALAAQIRSDAIDILVDLSGHTAGNRLRAFARKPAPIQITYLGYPNTTGITAIDYRLTDVLADPPGTTDYLNVEKLWRLPSCAWCYDPPADAPEIQLRAAGPITFGSFNALPKINRELIAIWAGILKRVPESRLLLKSAGAAETSSRERLTTQFAQHGISADRIEARSKFAAARAHLELYRHIDVALDTYPYHGTATTCEALWMGVPVVTLAGRTHLSRVGISLLTSAGLPELIAQTPDEYVSIAAQLAADPSRLLALRAGLRSKLKSSPLLDGPRFAADVDAAYRQMWQTWCASRNTS